MVAATCPYCNTQLAEPVPGLCPRCGEPLRAAAAFSANPPGPTAHSSGQSGTGRSNRVVAGIVLGVMGVMFLVALAFALWTKDAREKRHLKVSREAIATPSNPLDLPGLGYLPPETNVVAALRPADLLEDSQGKALLAAPRPALLELVLSAAEKWTGSKAENIDHLVAGATLTAEAIPPVTVVLQTRRPYDPAVIAEALRSKATTYQGRPLFRFSFDPAGQGYLLCASERVMVMILRVVEGVKIEDLDNIPRRPWDGAEALPRPLREALGRIDKDALAWVAGELPEKTPLDALLALTGGKRPEMLALLQSFGVGLVPEEKTLRLSGALRGRSQQATVNLRVLVDEWSFPGAQIVVHGPPSFAALAVQHVTVTPFAPGISAAAVEAALAKELPRGAEAFWVSLQMRVPVEKLREWSERSGLPF